MNYSMKKSDTRTQKFEIENCVWEVKEICFLGINKKMAFLLLAERMHLKVRCNIWQLAKFLFDSAASTNIRRREKAKEVEQLFSRFLFTRMRSRKSSMMNAFKEHHYARETSMEISSQIRGCPSQPGQRRTWIKNTRGITIPSSFPIYLSVFEKPRAKGKGNDCDISQGYSHKPGRTSFQTRIGQSACRSFSRYLCMQRIPKCYFTTPELCKYLEYVVGSHMSFLSRLV